MAEIVEGDEVQPTRVVDGEEHQLAGSLTPGPICPLWDDSDAQSDDVVYAARPAGDGHLDGRGEVVVGESDGRAGCVFAGVAGVLGSLVGVLLGGAGATEERVAGNDIQVGRC